MEQKRKSILIIDDDTRNVFALSLVLRSKGYEIQTAGDAQSGINLMLERNNNTGILLLDMMMPDMDGYQALQQIRATAELKHMPVIAVTAQAMPGDQEKCLQAGADGYISKPIDLDILTGILTQYLP